jgi:hypothetical protein
MIGINCSVRRQLNQIVKAIAKKLTAELNCPNGSSPARSLFAHGGTSRAALGHHDKFSATFMNMPAT